MDLSVNGPKVFIRISALFERFGDMLGNLVTQTTVTLFTVTVILIILAVIINKKLSVY